MKSLLIWLGALGYALVMGLTIGRFPWFFTLILGALPLLAIQLANRELFLLLPFAFLHSGLYVPGIPGNFQLYHLLCFLYIAHRILTRAVLKEHVRHPWNLCDACVFFLLLWILLLMGVRGSGLRVLGSREMGGGFYLQALLSLWFYLVVRTEKAKIPNLRLSFFFLALLGVLPLLANAAFELSGGKIWYQMLIIRAGGALGETAAAINQGNPTRLSFLSHGVPIVWLGFLFRSPRGNRPLILGAGFAAGLFCAVFSGYRSTALSTLMFIGLYLFSKSRRKGLFILFASIGGLIAYAGLALISHRLPFPAQRILSSLPGMRVSAEAAAGAMGTLFWRLDVWSLAMEDFSQYWLLGRGLTFDPSLIPLMDWATNSPFVAYSSGAFHHATLELLILYGIPALIACFLFYFQFLYKNALALWRQPWRNGALRDWAQAVLIFIFVRTLITFLIGSSSELFTVLPLWMALYNLIRNSDEDQPTLL